MPTTRMVVMLLKELRTIFVVQLAWIKMLVVIFINVLFGGLGYGTLQPYLQDGKGCSTRNRVKEKGLILRS